MQLMNNTGNENAIHDLFMNLTFHTSESDYNSPCLLYFVTVLTSFSLFSESSSSFSSKVASSTACQKTMEYYLYFLNTAAMNH